MSSVGAAQTLDRLVGAPAGLQQVVDPELVVGAGQIGVIAAPGAAGHGEDQDALGAVHEGGGLGEIGGCGPATQRQALALRVRNTEHTPEPARHLGDRLVTETLHDLVQCCRHRRQGGELLDQRVTADVKSISADYGDGESSGKFSRRCLFDKIGLRLCQGGAQAVLQRALARRSESLVCIGHGRP